MSMTRIALIALVAVGFLGYAAFSVITSGQVLGIDARLFLVAAPILIALTWAAINIGQAAIGQFKMMLNGGESRFRALKRS